MRVGFTFYREWHDKKRNVTHRHVTIPRTIATDSSFPFKPGDRLQIHINNSGLTLKKVQEKEQ